METQFSTIKKICYTIYYTLPSALKHAKWMFILFKNQSKITNHILLFHINDTNSSSVAIPSKHTFLMGRNKRKTFEQITNSHVKNYFIKMKRLNYNQVSNNSTNCK